MLNVFLYLFLPNFGEQFLSLNLELALCLEWLVCGSRLWPVFMRDTRHTGYYAQFLHGYWRSELILSWKHLITEPFPSPHFFVVAF